MIERYSIACAGSVNGARARAQVSPLCASKVMGVNFAGAADAPVVARGRIGEPSTIGGRMPFADGHHGGNVSAVSMTLYLWKAPVIDDPDEAAVAARNISEPGLLADMVAYSPDMSTDQRQELLETIRREVTA